MSRARGFAMDTGWELILEDAGVSVADVLRRARLPEDLLARGDRFVATADFVRFVVALEDEVADPAFALRLTEATTAEAFSPTIFAALCSPDLRTALQRLAHYKRLCAPMRLELDERPGELSVSLIWTDARYPVPRTLYAGELAWLVHLARMATRHRVVPLGVTSPVLLGADQTFTDWFGVQVQEADVARVRFSDQDAARPFLTANDGMWSMFEPDLKRRLAQLDARATTSDRVRAVLLEGLPSGRTTVDEVGSRLAMSRRTLQRRLRDEGTTFKDELRAVRRELAEHYLQRTDLTASEIGFLLGFEETSSFFRAFQAWTGTTPEAARRAATG